MLANEVLFNPPLVEKVPRPLGFGDGGLRMSFKLFMLAGMPLDHGFLRGFLLLYNCTHAFLALVRELLPLLYLSTLQCPQQLRMLDSQYLHMRKAKLLGSFRLT